MNGSHVTRFRQPPGSESTHIPTTERADRWRGSSYPHSDASTFWCPISSVTAVHFSVRRPDRGWSRVLFAVGGRGDGLFGQPATPATPRLREIGGDA
jgi:hypothetical protein